MHTYYLKIDGIDGGVMEVHHQGWLQISAHVVSDDRDSPASKRGRWTGGIHVSRVGTYDDQKEMNAGFHYLNVEAPLSPQLIQLFTLMQHKGSLPFVPSDAVLAAATERGHDCWQITFNDVMIVDFTVPASQTGEASIAAISLKFEKADTNLLKLGDAYYTSHDDPACYNLNDAYGRGKIVPGDE
ncbi:MAG: hypothetical protein ACJ8F7_00675 [Gemmataceae bacterium]